MEDLANHKDLRSQAKDSRTCPELTGGGSSPGSGSGTLSERERDLSIYCTFSQPVSSESGKGRSGWRKSVFVTVSSQGR